MQGGGEGKIGLFHPDSKSGETEPDGSFLNQVYEIHGGNDMSETILVTGASAGLGQRFAVA